MENENKEKKEKTILNDEQLKEVDGGVMPIYIPCKNLDTQVGCLRNQMCIWKGGKCVNGWEVK